MVEGLARHTVAVIKSSISVQEDGNGEIRTMAGVGEKT